MKKIKIKDVAVNPPEAPDVFAESGDKDFDEHVAKVKSFTNKVVDLVEEENVDPVVVADGLQLLMIAVAKTSMGDLAAGLLKNHLVAWQDQAVILRLLKKF